MPATSSCCRARPSTSCCRSANRIPYLRGLVVWLGFNQVFVPVRARRAARRAARTFRSSARTRGKHSSIGMTSFSFLPIYACFALAAIGLAASVSPACLSGPLLAALTFFWATTLAAIGGLGIYLIRIYKDVRGRPAYIVKSTIGVNGRKNDHGTRSRQSRKPREDLSVAWRRG